MAVDDKKISKLWRAKAELREGVVYKTYFDTKKYLTGGIGHLLTKAQQEKYPFDTSLPEQLVEAWFVADSAKATAAAKLQAKEIGIETEWFIVALISVNFQLGTNWGKKFHTTWPAIVAHEYDRAIANLRKSKWYRETPVRVEDFINALERAKNFKARPLPRTRTVQGASAATVGTLGTAVAEPIAEAANQIEQLAPYSDALQWVFILLTLAGIGLTIYARIDDRNKGHR